MESVKRPSAPQLGNIDAYAEERVPFDVVMRKLANTKPPHKAAKSAPRPAPKKTLSVFAYRPKRLGSEPVVSSTQFR